MSYTPWDHVPRDARPTPPPATVQVAGRLFSTYYPERLRQAAARWPADWARVDTTIAEHCPDAVVTGWQPSEGYGLGIWCVHVRDRTHEVHMQRIRAIQRELRPLSVVVEVEG